MTRPAVMADVAKLAGVSNQTISRVLNNSERVSSEMRERVLDAITKLNYRPNSTARALASGRSRTVGVITLDMRLYGLASALVGIEHAAHDAGFFVSVSTLRSLDLSSVLSAADNLRRQNVAGILVLALQRDVAKALTQLPHDLPVVAIESGAARSVPIVAAHHSEGAAQATRYLLDLGHQTVWHIAGPQDWLGAVERLEGWRQTLESAGANVPRPLVGDWSARSGYELAEDLAGDPAVSAIFVANDAMALGVLRRLHEASRSVPSSVSVVGFDDMPEAAFYTPPLTTIRQDFVELGRSSFELILEEINGGERAESRPAIATDLIVRASTGPPA